MHPIWLLGLYLAKLTSAAFPPGPPTIIGPVSEASTYIQISNLAPTVTDVIVYDTTGLIVAGGMPINIRHGRGLVPVQKALIVERDLTAQQASDGGLSGTSPGGLVRVDPFNQPGPPTVASLVHTCMPAIRVSNVLVGATVIVSYDNVVGSVQLGKTYAMGTSDIWIDLDPNKPLSAGDILTISQSVTFAGTTKVGKVDTGPLVSFDLFMGNAGTEIDVAGSLHACDTTVGIRAGIPGAAYTKDNKGSTSSFHSPNFGYTLSLGTALQEDIVIFAQQPLPVKCERAPAPAKTFSVSAATTPPAPTNSPPPCPDSASLKFTNIVEHGSLIIHHTGSSGREDRYEWGNGDGDVPVPPGWTFEPSTSTEFYQVDACGQKSALGRVVTNLDTSTYVLNFLSDLYECSTFVAFSGNPSSRTSVWWNDRGINSVQLSQHRVIDNLPPLVIEQPVLWEKLVPGRELFLRQDGCGHTVDSVDRRTVKRLPDKLSVPEINQDSIPVTSTSIKVRNVLPGAHIQVFVDATPYGEADAYFSSLVVNLVGPPFPGGRPLVAGQTISVEQSFHCGSGILHVARTLKGMVVT